MSRSIITAAAVALTLGSVASASAQTEYFQELLINGTFETGDFGGWEEDNAFGGNKWSVVTGPLGASGMTPGDGSQFATPFNSGPSSMPWGTLLQSIDLESITYPTILIGDPPVDTASLIGGGPAVDTTDQTVIFPVSPFGDPPVHIPGGDDDNEPGGTDTPPRLIQLVPTDRMNVSVEAIYGYDTVEFELRYLSETGEVLRVDDLGKHGYQPEIGEGPWDGVNKVITDEVILPEDTRYISFWARTELVLGTYIDAGFDNASLQLELVPGEPVPEPSGLALVALGGLMLRRRR